MGERLLCKQEVIGSIPFTSTTHCQWHVGERIIGPARQRYGFRHRRVISRRWRLLMDNCEEVNCVTEAVSALARPYGFA